MKLIGTGETAQKQKVTSQNAHPLSNVIKDILKALSNVAAERKKNDFYKKKKKKAQLEVTTRIHTHTEGYENYYSIKSDNSLPSSSVHEIPDNIRWVAYT